MVTLTYNNIRVNKDGEWIGTPIQVERCVNDLVLVDKALNDSMLNPRLLKKKNDDQKNDGNKHDEEDKSGYIEDDRKNEESNA